VRKKKKGMNNPDKNLLFCGGSKIVLITYKGCLMQYEVSYRQQEKQVGLQLLIRCLKRGITFAL